MAEYIERGAVKDIFCNACSTKKRYKRTIEECRNYIDPDGNRCFKMRLIDDTPTADVVEVVHGHWIPHYQMLSNKYETVPIATEFECSECGMRARNEYEYCHCGARMDGKDGKI